MSFYKSGHLLTSAPTFKWEAGKFKIIRIISSNLNICKNWIRFWLESERIIFSIPMICNHIQTKYCALRNYFWELVVLIHYILPSQNMLNYPVISIAPKWSSALGHDPIIHLEHKFSFLRITMLHKVFIHIARNGTTQQDIILLILSSIYLPYKI